MRVHVDARDASPGFKFNDWELKGVPLRIELGPRDLAAGTAVIAMRIGEDGKQTLPLEGLADSLPARLDAYHDTLLARAQAFLDERRDAVHTWERFVHRLQDGWADALHCGRPECEDDIKAETGATPRCIPSDGEPDGGPVHPLRLAVGVGQGRAVRPRLLTLAGGGCHALRHSDPQASRPSGIPTLLPGWGLPIPPPGTLRNVHRLVETATSGPRFHHFIHDLTPIEMQRAR